MSGTLEHTPTHTPTHTVFCLLKHWAKDLSFLRYMLAGAKGERGVGELRNDVGSSRRREPVSCGA